jgi:hypothetical protein
MPPISPTTERDDFSTQVLKQIAWFSQELAKAEESELDYAELTSIRAAILKSLADLRTLYNCRPPHAEGGDHGCM